MNYDKILDKIFFLDNGTYNKSAAVRYNLRKKRYKNLRSYILYRYNDSCSSRETLYRIHYNIDNVPLCPICGKKLKFKGDHKRIFLSHCSNKCKKLDNNVNIKWKASCGDKSTNRLKAKQTMLLKYGYENPFQIPEIINKIRKSNKEKSKEIIEKQKKTCLIRYGVDSYLKTDKIKIQRKETSIKKYGVDHPMKSEKIKEKFNRYEIVKKINKTKELNNSFNTSKDEDTSYDLIKEKYPNTIRQYKSKEYPFNCDFYIPEIDAYIECQYGWQHGKHPYDMNNKEDVDYINKIKNKHTKYYDNVIYNWTIRDPKKREIANQNKLNYIEFWNLKELIDWLKNKN